MSISKIVKNEFADWKYQQFLRKNSGDTTVRLYNDLKYILRDMGNNQDHLAETFKETLCNVYNQPMFVVDRLIEQGQKYLNNKIHE